MLKFLQARHLLLVDGSSNGLFFYFAPETADLANLDFKQLRLLPVADLPEGIFKHNLLADPEKLRQAWQALQSAHHQPDRHTQVVMLLNERASQLEQEAMRQTLPFYQSLNFVKRHFFNHFYINESRNFSKQKLIVQAFSDCMELSFFADDKLLLSQTVALHNFRINCQNFLKKSRALLLKADFDCFYLFTNHQAMDANSIKQLSQDLSLEATVIKQI
jgi:hypothetical protein